MNLEVGFVLLNKFKPIQVSHSCPWNIAVYSNSGPKAYTLWCQLEDSVLLIGTLLLFDPVLFPKYEAWLLIGSILNFEALLGAALIKTTQHLLHIPLKVCLLIGSWLFQCLEAWLLIGTCLLIGTKEYSNTCSFGSECPFLAAHFTRPLCTFGAVKQIKPKNKD